jgi:uncharacterized iron-regulated membrane protein
MTSISLQFVALYALSISAVLMWLTRRRTSAVAAAAVALAVCVVLAAVQVLALGLAMPTRQAIQVWLVLYCYRLRPSWGCHA